MGRERRPIRRAFGLLAKPNRFLSVGIQQPLRCRQLLEFEAFFLPTARLEPEPACSLCARLTTSKHAL